MFLVFATYCGIDECDAVVEDSGGDELASWLHAGVEYLAVQAVDGLVHAANRRRLDAGQAAGRLVGAANQRFGPPVAQLGVLDDAVDRPVEPVALSEHLGVDDGPHCRGHKGGRRVGPQDAEEVVRRVVQMVEVDGGRAGDDAVKVVREVLSFLEALAAAGGAAEIVGLEVFLAVETRGELFAYDDAGVD